MDRLSFIKENQLTETERNCGQMVCECDEVEMSNSIQSIKTFNPLHLVGLTIAAFLCAIVFAMYQRNAAKTNNKEWVKLKDKTIIACSSSEQTNSNKSWPEKKNGNCAHQFADLPGKFGNKKNKIHSC